MNTRLQRDWVCQTTAMRHCSFTLVLQSIRKDRALERELWWYYHRHELFEIVYSDTGINVTAQEHVSKASLRGIL